MGKGDYRRRWYIGTEVYYDAFEIGAEGRSLCMDNVPDDRAQAPPLMKFRKAAEQQPIGVNGAITLKLIFLVSN